MLVVEKKRHIRASITGSGTKKILNIIKEQMPDAEIIDDSGELVKYDDTDLAREIKASKTPGKLLRAYRERAGLSVVELAAAVGSKYPNISAMENDRRSIGLNMAKKLGSALNVDFKKFLA